MFAQMGGGKVDDGYGCSAGRKETRTRTRPIFRIWKICCPPAPRPNPGKGPYSFLEPPQMPTQMREGWRFQGWLWALGEMDQYEDRADLWI